MTLQQLQALDVSLCYASIMDTLGDTPYALKIAYVPSLTPTEIECELDPKSAFAQSATLSVAETTTLPLSRHPSCSVQKVRFGNG